MPSKFMSTTIALVLIIPLIGVWFMPAPAQASQCFGVGDEEYEVDVRTAYGNADLVMRFRVVAADHPWSIAVVTDVWRGMARQILYIVDYQGLLFLEPNKEYLWYNGWYCPVGLPENKEQIAILDGLAERRLPSANIELGDYLSERDFRTVEGLRVSPELPGANQIQVLIGLGIGLLIGLAWLVERRGWLRPSGFL